MLGSKSSKPIEVILLTACIWSKKEITAINIQVHVFYQWDPLILFGWGSWCMVTFIGEIVCQISHGVNQTQVYY